MAVTDLTDSLPWWARNGSGAVQGPGATGGPGATPQGAGDPSQPPPGVDPTQWLRYLQQMGGLGSANAADAGHGDGNNPPVDPRLGFSVGVNATPPPRPLMSSVASQPNQGGGYPPDPNAPDPVGNYAQTVGNHGMWPTPPVGPSAPAPGSTGPASPVAAPAPLPGPMASGGAAGTPATSNPRFVSIDRPNADPTARPGGPQMSALNLAGLFGRGQPAVNPNVPAANAQPVAAQRPVPGPLANAPMPPIMPGDIRNKRVANAIKDPNWWQNL